jgi:hypothetical protein
MIAVFFISTIVTTRETPMWKSSPLPLLHMMSSDTPTSANRMRKEAMHTRMGLRRRQFGWQMLDTTEEKDISRKEGREERRVAE